MQNLESVAALREKKRRELLAESKEQDKMTREDLLSSLPPLSKPTPVRCTKCNADTMWIEWDRIYQNAHRVSIDPKSVRYMLFMKNGFQNFLVNDRVLVVPKVVDSAATTFSGFGLRSRQRSFVDQRPQTANVSYSQFFDESAIRHPGEITKVW